MTVATDRIRRKLAIDLASIPVLGTKATELYLRRKYGARVVTAAKVSNFVQAQREKHEGAVECRSLPWIVNLDTFSGCNLKCPFCPTGTDQMQRPKTRMPLERAKRVIDAVREHTLEIRLYNWGEPFLNPDIFEVIRYARDAGLFTVISSNMSVQVPDLASRLVASGLDRLTVSLDGVSQKTLEAYRRRADLQLCFDNIAAITAERARVGATRPAVDLLFLVFRHNEHELALLEPIRRRLGADRFVPRRGFIFHDSFVPENPDYQPLTQVFKGSCDFLYSELTIEAGGSISPCCTNTSTAWDVGSIADLEGDLQAFWNNESYRAMRAFTTGKPGASDSVDGRAILCATCDLIDHPGCGKAKLSPLPPSFKAIGIRYEHGLDQGVPPAGGQ